MNDLFIGLTHALNGLIGASVDTYRGALFQVEVLPWMLTVLALTSLWFYGEPGVITAEAGLPTRAATRSRIMMAQTGVVTMLAAALVLQRLTGIDAPLLALVLQIPLPPDQLEALRSSTSIAGSFPALPALVVGAAATLGYTLRPVFGYALAAAGLYLSLLMIGTGLYWPQNVFAGLLMGISGTSLGLLALYPLSKHWRRLAIQFQIRPALLYPAGFLFLLEMANAFPTFRWIVNGVLDRVLPGV
jgi:hypothetical protein